MNRTIKSWLGRRYGSSNKSGKIQSHKRPLQFRNEDDMLRYFGINPNSVTDV